MTRPFALTSALALIAALALTAASALTAVSAVAAVTKTFRQATSRDFEEGQPTASLILPEGLVVPGMKPTPVAVDAAFVWCAALSPDGRTAYFGTGDEGRVFAVDARGGPGPARDRKSVV